MKYFLIIIYLLFSWEVFAFQMTKKAKDDFNEVGLLYFEEGEKKFNIDIDSSIFLFKKSLDIFIETENKQYQIESLNSLVASYYYIDLLDSAIVEAFRSKELSEKFFGKNSKYYAYSLNNLGVLFLTIGDYEKASGYFFKSFNIKENFEKNNLASLAIALDNIKSLYEKKGDYEEALNLGFKSLKIRLDTFGYSNFWVGKSFLEIGFSFNKVNKKDSAFFYYNKALNIIEKCFQSKSHYWETIIDCYHAIAVGNLEIRKYDESKQMVNKAKRIQKKHRSYKLTLSNNLLAQIHLGQKQYKKAQTHFLESIDLLEKKYGLQHPYLITYYLDYVEYFLAIEDYPGALEYIDKALNVATLSKNVDMKVDEFVYLSRGLRALKTKARTLKLFFDQQPDSLDLLESSFNYFKLTLALANKTRQTYLAQGSKELLAKYVVPVYEEAIEVALELYQQTNDKKYLNEAFAFAEGNKAMLLLESIQDNLAKGLGDIPDSLLEKENGLSIDLAFYQKKLSEEKIKGEKGDTEKIKRWENKVFDLRQEYNEFVAFLEKTYPKYHQLKYQPNQASVEDIQQQLLDDKTTLLEYFWGPNKLYVFAISQSDIQVMELPKDTANIKALENLLQLVHTPPNSQQAQEDYLQFISGAHGLYNWLLPRELFSTKENTNLIIIPDNLLNFLPFELLLKEKPITQNGVHYGKGLTYLLRNHTISYNYSATLLLDDIDEQTGRGFLGIAPSFQGETIASVRNCSSDELYSLQCSENEVTEIYAGLSGQTLVAEEANKKQFLALAPESQILHLATHACIEENNPLLNKIYFSDDYITAYDLLNMDLSADLAVLSACNTGRGELVEGEGVISLARNFIQAGCPSVVMSLWSVDDCATSDIMVGFYDQLKAGQPKNEALRQAKLNFLNQADRVYSHPYYWAAFVQIGQTQPLDIHLPWWQSNIALIAMLLLAGAILFLLVRRSTVK